MAVTIHGMTLGTILGIRHIHMAGTVHGTIAHTTTIRGTDGVAIIAHGTGDTTITITARDTIIQDHTTIVLPVAEEVDIMVHHPVLTIIREDIHQV